ncbi:unnamed protein product [Mytilus coruscus]|uniref:Retrotransposon gag domain-containing protein n=1 Tax=Mytilus coruscus TaxID=42192 RepID=A0A6J8D7V2_MYTCO|nr:unnamed protein product [Mytilus coruscus]
MKSAIKEEVHALGQFQQNRQGDNDGQRQWSNDRNRRQWNNAPQPWTNNKQRQGQQQDVPEQTKCRGCGKFCRDRRKCQAFNVECDNCGIWRHFASVFQAVARLNDWDDNEKLRELFPRLQGEAGDFAFDQLPCKTLDKYTKLIKELRNRFGVIESSRTYKLQFSRRRQFSGETPEKFASELKRLFDNSYKNRDFKTRQEDLLQMFLLGLQDYKARIHIKLNKDPQTIEEAVHEVITYSETMKNPNPDENNKKTVRQVNKYFGQLNGKKTTDDGKQNPNSSNTEVIEQKSKTLTIKEDELKSLFDKITRLWVKLGRVDSGDREKTSKVDFKGQNLVEESIPIDNRTPKVVNDEVKYKGGNDSSDVTDDRSLVKKKCIQEEENSLDVTNEKSLLPEIDEEVEVSSKVKDETPQSNKLDIICQQVTLLEKPSTLASANDQPLVEKGKAVFNLELGNLSLEKELVVAEIEDEVLLGLDILMKDEMGPADIKLTEGLILLNGVTIPCIKIGQPEPVKKVRAADDNFTIPPQSQLLTDVFVDKTENDSISTPQDYLIEPSSQFIENHPVMMASSLVDLCHDVTNKVRLINPFDQEVQINQDTVVGLH